MANPCSIIVSCIIILSGFVFAQKAPKWITNMPQDSDYYWAREGVNKKGLSENEYKSKANERALITISMQLSSNVSSSTESNIYESGTEIERDYSQSQFMSTMADIDGAEKFADYNGSSQYWVVWRLKKSKHEENMERAAESAKGYYEFFLSFSDKQPVQQLQQLIPAYEDIIKVIGKDIIFGGGVNLRTEIPSQLSRILYSIRIVPEGETSQTGKVNTPLSKPLKVKTRFKRGVDPSDIPIRFVFEGGEGDFSHDVSKTSKSGKAETKVTKIISRKRVQSIRAQIDLGQWRENKMKKFPAFEKHLAELSRSGSVLFQVDVSEVTQQKIAVIAVVDNPEVINKKNLKRINRSLRSEFIDITEFKLKDETLVESIIDKYEKSANICSDEECQIEIGKKLGVEQLVFIDIRDYPLQTAITIFLRDIVENELVMEYTYEFDHSEKADNEEKIDLILDNGPYMIEDFWYRMNPGYLTLNSPGVRGVKASFTFIDPTEWMDAKFEKRFPLTQEKFFEGEYEINVNKLGYEKFHTRFEVSMGDYPEFDINLKAKTPFKAFLKSVIIPGRGQMYSSDIDHRGRMVSGMTYLSLSLLGLAGSGFMWDQYYQAKDVYSVSKSDYADAIEIVDIDQKKDMMTNDFNDMTNKKNTAIALTGITAGLWVFNAVDAMIFFPEKYKRRRLSLKLGGTSFAGLPGAKAEIGLRF